MKQLLKALSKCWLLAPNDSIVFPLGWFKRGHKLFDIFSLRVGDYVPSP